MLCVSDCVRDGVWLAIPKPTEWQRIGNQIDAAMIFARAHFVNVDQLQRRNIVCQSQARLVVLVFSCVVTFLFVEIPRRRAMAITSRIRRPRDVPRWPLLV